MREASETWWDDLRQTAELPPEPPPSRLPAILAAVLAVAASAGLGWWLSSSGQADLENPPASSAPAARTAGALDANQVRRAYQEFTTVYAESGPDGLARLSESCATSLRREPRILDFCLAFDLYAESVWETSDRRRAAEAEARRLMLAQSALPAGVDAGGRLEAIRKLIGIARPGLPEAPTPIAQTTLAASDATPARRPAASKTQRLAKADPVRRQAASIATAECRQRPIVADRLTCADPTLRRQERLMKAAYERALAAGADPLVVDRAQAEWRRAREYAVSRSELSQMYARRTRELNDVAVAAAEVPPS